MPLYEYKCEGCGKKFADLAPPGQALPSKTCTCGAEGVRIMSTFCHVIPPWMSDENISANAENRRALIQAARSGQELERDHLDDQYDAPQIEEWTPPAGVLSQKVPIDEKSLIMKEQADKAVKEELNAHPIAH